MSQLEVNTAAPEFEIEDIDGNMFRLADFREKKHVLMVFNRGFL